MASISNRLTRSASVPSGARSSLQRGSTAQPDVFGGEDLTHAAGADQPGDSIGSDRSAAHRLGFPFIEPGCCRGRRQRLEAIAGAHRQQRFDFVLQIGIAAACSGQEASAIGDGQGEGVVKQLLGRTPSLVLHGVIERRRPRASHARANCQSRAAVTDDTRSTCAISSIVNPAKRRISATCAFRASRHVRRSNAASRSIRLVAGSADSASASSRDTRRKSPPCLVAPRRRAWSTRMNRISLAERRGRARDPRCADCAGRRGAGRPRAPGPVVWSVRILTLAAELLPCKSPQVLVHQRDGRFERGAVLRGPSCGEAPERLG